MKILAKAIFILGLLSNLTIAGTNEEFRSTWVITWEFSKSSDDTATSKARIRKILDDHKEGNFNAVLWQVRQGGRAYYNSSYEPWGGYSNGPYPGGYDPLQFAIEEAHKRGIELHAWFNTFAASSTAEGAPAHEHPEWVCRDGYGVAMPSRRALSPGLKAVRDYTLDVAMEVVNNYDIDGIHLDYIRWNEHDKKDFSGSLSKIDEQEHQFDGMISEEKAERLLLTPNKERYLYDVEHPYNSTTAPDGFSTWEDWWRASTTEFVKALHDSIQLVKPWVRLSAAALGKYNWFSWNGYHTVFQDAALWFNEGDIDQLTPMHYHWTSGQSFYEMLAGADGSSTSSTCWGKYIQVGIDAGRLFSAGPGSYVLADYNIWYKHKEIIDRSRTVDWVDGFQFFSYGTWDDYRYWDDAGRSFFKRKTKIRATKLISATTPDAPSISVVKLDSLNYDITVTPVTLSKNQWFAIYRSDDYTLDVDTDEIVDIHFGQNSYNFTDEFTGDQDFNGIYTYYSTMLDRYWNESDRSNAHSSYPIPSFAPRVVGTFPAQGDTIKINSDIIIKFSKTMNTETFINKIVLEPSINIFSFSWSNENKNLKIKLESEFEYATAYTLTISDSVMDINGKRLDGNGDGGDSEPYVLHFRTKNEDTDGPLVVYHNSLYNFDVEGIVMLSFDELIDDDTIDENSVSILYKQEPVSTKTRVYTMDDISVLGIQPEEPFGPNADYTVIVDSTVTDILGNPLETSLVSAVLTESYIYSEKKVIANFSSVSDENWRDPDFSGQTTGTIAPNTTFKRNTVFYLPAATRETGQKTAGELHYEWDPEASNFFIREYLMSSSAEAQVIFDTSYVLQCYIFGDGGFNQLRYSLSEKNGSGYALEVSNWITIDWIGWKLLEWDLSDPNSVGSWLGNEILDGNGYSFDSFQLTNGDGSAMVGSLYFQHLRAIKKEFATTDLSEDAKHIPLQYSLSQNYPNPFNPLTKIDFSVAKPGKTEILIFDILGRKVTTLVNEYKHAGKYSVIFDGTRLASGTYIYQLRSGNHVFSKKMILMK